MVESRGASGDRIGHPLLAGRGVDGFRIDVVHRLAKDPQLRDNPPAVASARLHVAHPTERQPHGRRGGRRRSGALAALLRRDRRRAPPPLQFRPARATLAGRWGRSIVTRRFRRTLARLHRWQPRRVTPCDPLRRRRRPPGRWRRPPRGGAQLRRSAAAGYWSRPPRPMHAPSTSPPSSCVPRRGWSSRWAAMPRERQLRHLGPFSDWPRRRPAPGAGLPPRIRRGANCALAELIPVGDE